MENATMRPAGDRRTRGEVSEQALGSEERALVMRAYSLFDFFEERLREQHEQMRSARRMREHRQDEKSATAPSVTATAS